jgi:pimeloyl-ACP methyl ester carboxylesterase
MIGEGTLSNIRSLKFAVGEGLALAGTSYGDPGSNTVLFLHGAGQTQFSWGAAATRIAQEGWHAITIDLRGHGESDWASDADYSQDAFASDIEFVARSLPTKPVIVGASLGGLSALIALGERAPDIARALVLVDIVPGMNSDEADRILAFMRAYPGGFESLTEAATAVSEYLPNRPRPADPSGLAKNLQLGSDGRYRWHWDPKLTSGPSGLGKNRDPERLRAAARSLLTPCLLIRGARSELVTDEGVQDFVQLVPHTQVADVSGAGHMVAGDRNDAFADAVLKFLASLA